MALSDAALTTLARAKAELGITGSDDDTLIEGYIEDASAEFADEAGREFYYVEGHTERTAGYGDETLLVKEHIPIDTVTSIQYDDGSVTDTVDAGDYEVIRPELGEIRHIDGFWLNTARIVTDAVARFSVGDEEYVYIVTYDGGYVTQVQADNDGSLTRDLPRDIERAVLDKVTQMYRSQGRDYGIDSKKVGAASVSYRDGAASAYPPSWQRTVNRYKIGGWA